MDISVWDRTGGYGLLSGNKMGMLPDYACSRQAINRQGKEHAANQAPGR